MLSNIKIILPIALALFLPMLNIFTNSKDLDVYSTDFFLKWLGASFVLLLLWYTLDFASKSKNKRKMLLIALAIGCFIGLLYLFLTLPIFDNLNVRWMLAVKLFSASVLFLIIQYALQASQNIAQLKIEKEQIQAENYRVQLQELRQKVDPHFLFNSMNTLRTMIRNQHPQSEEFVMNLSGFYRQTLKHNDSSTVCLKEELDVLKSYLFLMQIRNEGKVIIDIDVNDSWSNHLLPTLSLQIIAENCFKHNQASIVSPLKIQVCVVEDFYISVGNNVQPKFSKSESSGYGLDNIRKRYKLLGIPEGVVITQSTDHFEVKLKLI